MAELQDAVKKFASDLAEKIESFIGDVTEIKVQTYTVSAEGETLHAETTVSFDGDTVVKVPLAAGGEINKAVWDLHQSVVRQAMLNRATMIRSVGDAAASAFTALGMAGE